MLRTPLLIAAIAIWLAGIGSGFGALWRYSATPGESRSPAPSSWPTDSLVTRTANTLTLVMFAHPRCPCSEASATELSWLAERYRGRFTATVLFVRPADVEEGWEKARLWTTVSALAGVTARRDDDGREAARFGTTTSGHVVLYDAGGRLVFSGGITGARGHVGDNLGRQAVAALLGAGDAPRAETPVYGCSLCDVEVAR